jgi:membrane fusion protein, multidrug efflux system
MAQRHARKIIGIILVILSLWAGFHYWKTWSAPAGGGPAIPPTVVDAAPAQQQAWYDQIKATGTMSAFQGVMLKPQVAGQITKIQFQSGTYIKKDTALFQIYPDIVKAQLERNQAALKLAELDYARGKILFEKNVISRQDFDKITSDLQQNQANVAQAEAQLLQYNITAPFDGMLGLKEVDVGSYVTMGQNLVQLQQITPIRVEFTVPEVYLNKVALGQTVDIAPSYNPQINVVGKVYALNSAINTDTRTLAIWAKVPNDDHKLMPGMFVEVTLYAGNQNKVITVPQTSIVYSPQGLYVYKVVDKKAVKTIVTVGLRKGNDIEVTSGLEVGQIVVTAGQIKLIDNAPVIVKPPAAPRVTPSKNDLSDLASTQSSTDNSRPAATSE